MKLKWTSTKPTSRACRDGQQVNAILDAYPDWQIPAKVRTVIPTADRQKATVKVRIIRSTKLDPRRILPDMGVKVDFLGDDEPKHRHEANGPRGRSARSAKVRFARRRSVQICRRPGKGRQASSGAP